MFLGRKTTLEKATVLWFAGGGGVLVLFLFISLFWCMNTLGTNSISRFHCDFCFVLYTHSKFFTMIIIFTKAMSNFQKINHSKKKITVLLKSFDL